MCAAEVATALVAAAVAVAVAVALRTRLRLDRDGMSNGGLGKGEDMLWRFKTADGAGDDSCGR